MGRVLGYADYYRRRDAARGLRKSSEKRKRKTTSVFGGNPDYRRLKKGSVLKKTKLEPIPVRVSVPEKTKKSGLKSWNRKRMADDHYTKRTFRRDKQGKVRRHDD